MNPRGKTALITGASSGIGAATARALAEAGAARVLLLARRAGELERVAASIGPAATAYPVDLSSASAVDQLAQRINREAGTPDIIVNNAGAGQWKFVDETSPDEAVQMMAVPYFAAFYVTHAFLPGMLKRGHGHIVNVASLAGRFATPGASVYGASKHAVVAFSESLFYEVEDQGVLVTAVNPGFVRTESFPLVGMNPRMILTLERVADAVVRVVRDDIAPELSVPRYISPLQAFRVLTPPLYRWGVRKGRDMGLKGTEAADG